MRLRRWWQRRFFVKGAIPVKDAMGAVTTKYSDEAVTHYGNVQPVDRVNANTTTLEVYGAVDRQLFNIFIEGAGIKKRDGICLNVPDTEPPDLEVVDVLPWPGYTKIVARELI